MLIKIATETMAVFFSLIRSLSYSATNNLALLEWNFRFVKNQFCHFTRNSQVSVTITAKFCICIIKINVLTLMVVKVRSLVKSVIKPVFFYPLYITFVLCYTLCWRNILKSYLISYIASKMIANVSSLTLFSYDKYKIMFKTYLYMI